MKTIQNPILRGFCPDPCMIRTGDDYYIATSTFEWWPCVNLYHSKDLAHWEQLPSPLREPGQMDLRGDPNSGGIWAPDLSWDGQYYYLLVTNVTTKKGRWYNTHNYMSRAASITGPWSQPVYLNSIGFDPSLLHDTDGKCYLVNMVNGFKGVLVQQMDPETGALLGERRKVYSGSGIGCTEGPRIYHIGSWYYLVVAEGGTGYSHCVTIARSDNVFGPYETMPDNPLLTSDQNDLTAIQKCGHGSFVETQNGEWYMAHLCSRPNSARGSLLGRETALQKITWQDGWPRLACGGKIAQNAVPAPKDLPEVELPAMAEQDDFDVPALAPGYAMPRTPLGDCVNLTVRPGWLRLTGQESMNSLHHVTLVARRQQEHEMQAETRMDFAPVCPEQMAGFTYCYDSMNFYLLGKTCAEDGTPVLELLKSDTGVVEDVCDPVPVPDGTEGPRIYHIGSWYYLVVAEGGTGYSHCVTIARSDNVFGPYETMPDNPLLTSDQNDLTAIQKCGHGSFVETQNGEWYMAHLCSRPNSARGSLLGRETALQKITWQDGWPRLACGGKIAQNAVPAPKDLPEVELPAMAEQDDFDVPALAPGYAMPRTPLGDCVNLTVRPGWLRLTGQESMNSLHHVTLVARRQQEHEMQAETRMDFAPVCPEQMAGFTYCYDSMNFYLLGKTCAEDGTPVLELLKSDTGVVEDVCDPVPVPDGTLDFKLTTTPDGGMAQFYYRQPQGEWQSIGPACPTDILTDEHCRGFTGAHVGVYAHDMAGLHNHADFDYLNVHFER